MPKISVIMPVYNSEKYLREAMDSILNQTFSDFEFIIIDDGSSDSSPAIVRSYDDPRIRFYQNEHNMGVAATLNRGLDLAQGEYIARMDSDDISLPERFEKQVEFLDSNTSIVVCGTNIITFSGKGDIHKTAFPESSEEIESTLFVNSPFAHPSVMMRRYLFADEKIRYDSQFEGREDYRLWMQLSHHHKMANLHDALLRYRVHDGQVTQKKDLEKERKHYKLKTAFLEECGIVADEKMLNALCQVSVGEDLIDKDSVYCLQRLFWKIVEQKKYQDFPDNYDVILIRACRSAQFTLADIVKFTKELPLKKRVLYAVRVLAR